MFRHLFARRPPRARPRSPGRRLAVEPLEDRATPATFSVADVAVVEGNTGSLNAVVTVRLTGNHGNKVSVNFSTANGTAAAGSDYTAVTGTLTFTKSQFTRTLVVPILGDRLVEAGETFTVQLSNPKGASIADGVGVVTITDNEPRVSVSDPVVLEGNAGAPALEFFVTIPTAYDLPVTVTYVTTDGTAFAGEDYVAASGSVTIPAGQTSQPILIGVTDDRLMEADETVLVAVTTADGFAVVSDGAGVGTILDNEPRVSIDSYAEQDYYGSSITFYVYLAAAYDEAVTVDFTTWDGSAVADVDYVPTSGTVTFNPGETWQAITIQLLTFDPDPYKYFLVQLFNPSANATLANDLSVGYWNSGGEW